MAEKAENSCEEYFRVSCKHEQIRSIADKRKKQSMKVLMAMIPHPSTRANLVKVWFTLEFTKSLKT